MWVCNVRSLFIPQHSSPHVCHSCRVKVGCGYTRDRGIGRISTDCGEVRETFYRFYDEPPSAQNTAANTSDFLTVVKNFLSLSNKTWRECTRVLKGSRLGNNCFRSLTQLLLSNPRCRGVLLADRTPAFLTTIQRLVSACENNCVLPESQHLVKDQLCKLIKAKVLTWTGICDSDIAVAESICSPPTPLKNPDIASPVPVKVITDTADT